MKSIKLYLVTNQKSSAKKSGKILLRFQRGAKIHPKYFNKKEMFSGGK